MYTSVLLIGLAFMLYFFSSWKMTVFALLIFVLFFKAKREEDFWCVKTSEYKEFKKSTKMFIPFVL
jgi:protein-S-isoprenylcysteine O-methyltransferase Ste14